MSACNECPSTSISAKYAIDPMIRRVLWIALLSNLAMFVVEIVASWWSDSMALQADALDFFGDAFNYGVSLFVLGMALRQRAFAALFKGLCMAAFGLWVIVNAIDRALTGSAPDAMTMGGIAVLALVVNVVVAMLLYKYRGGDSNMRSIWLCSRNDAIGNVAVMVAAAGVFASGSHWPDLIVAALIAGLNLSAALGVVRLALAELRAGAQECEMEPPLTSNSGVH